MEDLELTTGTTGAIAMDFESGVYGHKENLME